MYNFYTSCIHIRNLERVGSGMDQSIDHPWNSKRLFATPAMPFLSLPASSTSSFPSSSSPLPPTTSRRLFFLPGTKVGLNDPERAGGTRLGIFVVVLPDLSNTPSQRGKEGLGRNGRETIFMGDSEAVDGLLSGSAGS